MSRVHETPRKGHGSRTNHDGDGKHQSSSSHTDTLPGNAFCVGKEKKKKPPTSIRTYYIVWSRIRLAAAVCRVEGAAFLKHVRRAVRTNAPGLVCGVQIAREGCCGEQIHACTGCFFFFFVLFAIRRCPTKTSSKTNVRFCSPIVTCAEPRD